MQPKTFAEYCAGTPELGTWILPSFIPADGWSLLQAPPKTGKSIMAAQIADALASGTKFLNWTPIKPWRVVYIQADAPPGDWHGQLTQLGFHNSTALTIDRAALGLFCLDNLKVRLDLKATLFTLKAEFVIWDALEKLSRADLNEKEGCQKTLALLEEVYKGPRLVIHHPRKMKEGGAWTNVDEVAGNHYLAGDASSIISVKKNGPLEGWMKITGRLMDSLWKMTRDPGDYRWLTAHKVDSGGNSSGGDSSGNGGKSIWDTPAP